MSDVISARHPPESEWLWAELRILQGRWSPVHHPVHARWLGGELTADELRRYAEEHDHVVEAVAAVARRSALKAGGGLLGDVLSRYADEQESHVGLWREFARATGWGAAYAWFYAADPEPETRGCARLLTGHHRRSLALDLVTLHVVETSQAMLAQPQLDALLRRYGFRPGATTAYFELHAEHSVHDAALLESALEGVLDGADGLALLAHAEAVHRGYRDVLDALERAAVR